MSRAQRCPRPAAGGFTLVELLVTVAIVGIIVAILIPNLIDSLQKAKQKRTVADMRELGEAWFSWLTDQTSAAAAGASQTTYNFDELTQTVTADDLLATLHVDSEMFYIQSVPEHDGWGRDYDYRWSGLFSSPRVLGIRSLGRDGQVGPTANPYPVGPFVASLYEEDIVWTDGYFIRYPAGAKTQ